MPSEQHRTGALWGKRGTPGRFLCNNPVSLTDMHLTTGTGYPGMKQSPAFNPSPRTPVQCYNLKDHTNLKPLRKQK
jgi:hypothetical protein